MRATATIVLGLSLMTAVLAAHPAPAIDAIYLLRNADVSGWQVESFAGQTRYRPIRADGDPVLRAHSSASASGLVRRIRVDLNRTPYLHWSWQVNRFPAVGNERSKAGDDFAARVYVIVSGGIAFWKTRALNYVWTKRISAGTHWPNPFTSSTVMLALRSGAPPGGTWHHERRNVKEDLRRLLGLDTRYVDAVAVMTDADNSGSDAAASYGDIYFSQR